MISGRFGIIPWYEHHSFSVSTFAISGTSPGWWNHMFSVYKDTFIRYILLGSLFYLLYWRQSRLKFCLQVTWLFSMTTPRDLEAHTLGCMTSNCGCWLDISLQWRHNERDDVSNYQPHDLSKCMHVTLCCTFHNKNAKKKSPFYSLIEYVSMSLTSTIAKHVLSSGRHGAASEISQ